MCISASVYFLLFEKSDFSEKKFKKSRFLMILAPLKASIYALEGGEALSHSNGSTGVNRTQVATPSFHAKSGLFCP